MTFLLSFVATSLITRIKLKSKDLELILSIVSRRITTQLEASTTQKSMITSKSKFQNALGSITANQLLILIKQSSDRYQWQLLIDILIKTILIIQSNLSFNRSFGMLFRHSKRSLTFTSHSTKLCFKMICFSSKQQKVLSFFNWLSRRIMLMLWTQRNRKLLQLIFQ